MAGAATLAGLIAALPFFFASEAKLLPQVLLGLGVLGGGGLAASLYWKGRCYEGGLLAVLFGLLVSWSVLEATLPKLDRLQVSERLSRALDDDGLHPLRDGAPPAAIAGYYEPSAVFLLGTRTKLTDAAGAFESVAREGGPAIVEAGEEAEFLSLARNAGLPLRALATIDGLNYSNGRAVRLTVYARAQAE
jgi:hypothetical protein